MLPVEKREAIDRLISLQMKQNHVPGLSLGIFKEGQAIYLKGYGQSNLELQVPVKPETIFQSGSMGKQFTATAIMLLVEDGKVGLDEPVSKYLPDTPSSWKQITTRHLLTHTSGLGDYTELFDLRKDPSEDELLRLVYKTKLDFKPGEDWRYSNLGYVTLGILIGKVTGHPYGNLLQERIFKPLGMSGARIISEKDLVMNRAAGYRRILGQIKNQAWVSPTFNGTADGSLYLSMLDMGKWDAALYTEALLKRSSLDLMWSPVVLKTGQTKTYGFGWEIAEVNKHRVVEHAGAWQGFMANISRYLDDKLTIVMFANLSGANVAHFSHQVASIVEPSLQEPAPQPIADPDPAMTQRFQALLQALSDGTLTRDAFTPDAVKELYPDVVNTVRQDLNDLGTLQSVSLLRRDVMGTDAVCRYGVRWGEALVLFRVRYDTKGRVVGLRFSID